MDGEEEAGVEGQVSHRSVIAKPNCDEDMPDLFQPGQDPRAYFVKRIRDQAKQEALILTDFESRYLGLTDQGDDSAACDLLKEIKRKAFDEFDSRISGLAWRAYQQDINTYSCAEESYQNAMSALAKVDECPNLGMFVNCIGLKTSPEELNKTSWWPTVILILIFVVLGLMGFLRRG
ncbi:MAG TPA: hypothetical protein VFT65_10505 [Candidatus Angelobacter sp.]|nr:hypothetical protein [Candidatus Angelobacter sp.]